MVLERLVPFAVAATFVMAFSTSLTIADPPEKWLTISDHQEQPIEDLDRTTAETVETSVIETETETVGYQKPLPLSLSLDYTLVSDYIFRGINLSEHAREGREMPNHQLKASMSMDLAPLWGGEPGHCGEIGFDAWFEWYADQKKINVSEGANIQEIDYTVWYGYYVEPIYTKVKIGWIGKAFPNLDGVHNDDKTNEWFLSLVHNDAWVWRCLGYQGEAGILNPTMSLYHDLHISGGVWVDLGISHGFQFEALPYLTITPSYALHIDGGWTGPVFGTDDHDTRLAGMTYGIDVSYDLTEVLRMPLWAGSMKVSGFLNYFDPTGRMRSTLPYEDELYGGVKLAWSW